MFGLATAATLMLVAAACDEANGGRSGEVAGGDPGRGADAIQAYGCGACHTVPGVRGANGQVGPPLTAMANRGFIGGRLPNTANNLIQWIISPQQFDPQNAMPSVGVSEEDARDIAAYLYTLE